MKFPVTPRVEYAQNPLAEVICQLRFPRQFAIEGELPVALQKRVANEFPLIEKRFNFEVALSDNEELSRPRRRTTYDFSSRKRDLTISLGAEFVAITSREYRNWAAFSQTIHSAWEAVRSIYGVSLITRVGLRYRNIIDREPLQLADVPWSELVRSELLGFLASDLDGATLATEASTSHLFRVDRGYLALNSSLVHSDDKSKSALLIDSDFYREDTIDGDQNVYMDILNEYNIEAGRLFRWAIKDRLRDRLLAPTN
ncbi:TIGR04255 family protein [Ensifer sp. YR511]|uniref:TIGR04255 family protein n=1 Tax=Ensifer sp. YR511 TaxID=1855294 RepID=UPI0008909966|nr:TIGR04255 family protein [Ensifer sp. YR511]SDM28404.1 TIGR04255 family protein [Ensifer sp. YR511]